MTRPRQTIDTGVTLLDGEELDVVVTFVYTPPTPGRMYERNGDPGYPPEPAEVEVLRIQDYLSMKDIDISDVCALSIQSIFESCMDAGEDDDARSDDD